MWVYIYVSTHIISLILLRNTIYYEGYFVCRLAMCNMSVPNQRHDGKKQGIQTTKKAGVEVLVVIIPFDT